MTKRLLPVLLASGLVLAACQSVPKEIPTSLSEREYFQLAYQDSDGGNYAGALAYYDTFLKRYPKDADRDVEAQYEIAFLFFKKNDLVKSRDLFTQLVDRYKEKDADSLPRWPLVLSNKLIIIIDQKIAEQNPKTAAAQERSPSPSPTGSAGQSPTK